MMAIAFLYFKVSDHLTIPRGHKRYYAQTTAFSLFLKINPFKTILHNNTIGYD